MKERSAFWDNYKGFLILLVVFGHFIYNRAVMASGGAIDLIFTLIYLFHMPAFVFSSGYFSRSENARSAKAVVRLVLYYLVFNTLLMLCYTVYRRQLPLLLTPYGSFWYLLCLIVWRLSVPYLSKVKGMLPLSVVAALLVGFWAEISNVLALSRAVVFFPFFLLGYRFDAERWLTKIKERNLLFKLLGIILAVLAAAAMCYAGRRYHLDVNMLCGLPYAYGKTDLLRRGLIFLCAGVGIVMLLLVIPHRRIPVLTNVGKNSLLIYVIHRFVVLVFDIVVPANLPAMYHLALALAATAVTVLIFGMDSSIPSICPGLCFISFAECRLKAKVVVEDTKGIPSFRATALPQTAMESATIQSGLNRSISAQTMSSRERVVSTRTRVDRARSEPSRAASSCVSRSSAS